MNPKTKTLLIVIGTILSVFLVPALLVLLHEYLMAILAIGLFIGCFILFGFTVYIELYPELKAKHQEEENIIHQFHGDKDKIRFYRGFKKYFDGDLSDHGLQEWFTRHPRL